jgi:hypothetical protein
MIWNISASQLLADVLYSLISILSFPKLTNKKADSHLPSFDWARLGWIIGSDAALENRDSSVIVDAEEERHGVSLLACKVGSTVKSGSEDAVRPRNLVNRDPILQERQYTHQNAKKSPMLTTNVPGIG